MTDELAERIATLGGEPNGNPGYVVEKRSSPDYPHGRTDIAKHLIALDDAYYDVIVSHRRAMEAVEAADPVSHDLLVGQSAKLEMAQWFIRSFGAR